jgi:hypothetical protein
MLTSGLTSMLTYDGNSDLRGRNLGAESRKICGGPHSPILKILLASSKSSSRLIVDPFMTHPGHGTSARLSSADR